MVRVTGINHMVLVTRDMEKSIHFYRDILGMHPRVALGVGGAGYATHAYVENFPMNRILNVSPGLRMQKVWFSK